MNSSVLSNRAFWNAEKVCTAIRESALYLCERVAHYFDNNTYMQFGLKFNPRPDDSRCLCTVSSPLGDARLVLDWEFEEGVLVGVLVAQCKRYDNRDSIFWEDVLSLYIPRDEANPYIKEGEGKIEIPIHINLGHDDDYAAALLKVGVSIYTGIVSGPR